MARRKILKFRISEEEEKEIEEGVKREGLEPRSMLLLFVRRYHTEIKRK